MGCHGCTVTRTFHGGERHARLLGYKVFCRKNSVMNVHEGRIGIQYAKSKEKGEI